MASPPPSPPPATPPCGGECLDRAFDKARQTLENDLHIFEYIEEGGSLSPDEAATLRARVKEYRPRLESARAAVLRHSELIDQWIEVNEAFGSLVGLEEEEAVTKGEEEATKDEEEATKGEELEASTVEGNGGKEGDEVTGEVTGQAMEVDGAAVAPEATKEAVEE
ncbi:hypothetical protein CspHIS471_0203590 [Cutaneotrichosporon sp. HIS471]|nr:hypothetical protein CspHIS471_0203590 [Cutaneotrichosporon sp. HIS471]